MAHIQIADLTPRVAYIATAAQDEFAVSFPFFTNGDLTVYLDDVEQVLDTDFSVDGAGESAGGSITLATPATGGESVVIVRDVAIERTTDFPASGPLQINSLNTQLDKLIAIDQQLQDDIVRTLRLADSDTSENLDIPIASERANKFLAFDADGAPFVAEAVEDQPASAFGLTLIDDATRQAALATLGVLAGRRTITGADTIVASDHGGIIEATSGTFTLAITAAATLGSSFWCILHNSGTGTVTVDPDGAELIDGVATAGMAHGRTIILKCTGSAFETIFLGDVAGVNGGVTDGDSAHFSGTGGKVLTNQTPVIPAPQGYLTPTTGVPVIVSDVSAGTAVYYHPFVGNLVPIYNGTRMVPKAFAELTLTLASQHAANQIYDVFVFLDSGTVTIGTGPAWTTPTAGAGARGTGAGTTQLSRVAGFWVNTVAMTARNGSTTYSVAANQGTYLGSIFMDGTNGQISCHVSWGQSRKWGVWNAYNRQPIHLKAGDSTNSWTHTSTIRASNNSAANSLTVFSGLAEERYQLRFEQKISVEGESTGGAVDLSGSNRIGWNSTAAGSGRFGLVGLAQDDVASDLHVSGNGVASFLQVASIGVHVVTCLEVAPTTTNPGESEVTWYGDEDNMVLSAQWRG